MQTPHHRPSILIVDDTEDIRQLLEIILAREGFHTDSASGGVEMDQILARKVVDLIILDSMMPGEDGLSICRRLQGRTRPPIIMLSAKGDDVDRIEGLNLGAEDFMSKPFNPKELIARINVVLRRAYPPQPSEPGAHEESFFGWHLSREARKLTAPNGMTMTLSAAEFAIFRVFLDHPDRPLTRDFILQHMSDFYNQSTLSALDTLISRLRRKLNTLYPSDDKTNSLIITVYGKGYMLRPAK